MSAYNRIKESIDNLNAFFVDTLLAKIRSRGEIALAMASSGIAALILEGGRTIHSGLKVHITLNELSVCNITKQSALAKLIQGAKLLVWDEAPMMHKHAAECIDLTLRDLCSNDRPSGGKVFVFGGDYRQILPIIRSGSSRVVSACLNRSSLWHNVKVVKLNINMHLRMDSWQDHEEMSNFSDLLLRVEEGTEPHDENNMIHLDHKYVVRGEYIGDLATAIYGNIKEHFNDRDYITPRIMMSPKNETAETINKYVIDQSPGEAKVLLSADSVYTSQAAMYHTEYILCLLTCLHTPSPLRSMRQLYYCAVLIPRMGCVMAPDC